MPVAPLPKVLDPDGDGSSLLAVLSDRNVRWRASPPSLEVGSILKFHVSDVKFPSLMEFVKTYKTDEKALISQKIGKSTTTAGSSVKYLTIRNTEREPLAERKERQEHLLTCHDKDGCPISHAHAEWDLGDDGVQPQGLLTRLRLDEDIQCVGTELESAHADSRRDVVARSRLRWISEQEGRSYEERGRPRCPLEQEGRRSYSNLRRGNARDKPQYIEQETSCYSRRDNVARDKSPHLEQDRSYEERGRPRCPLEQEGRSYEERGRPRCPLEQEGRRSYSYTWSNETGDRAQYPLIRLCDKDRQPGTQTSDRSFPRRFEDQRYLPTMRERVRERSTCRPEETILSYTKANSMKRKQIEVNMQEERVSKKRNISAKLVSSSCVLPTISAVEIPPANTISKALDTQVLLEQNLTPLFLAAFPALHEHFLSSLVNVKVSGQRSYFRSWFSLLLLLPSESRTLYSLVYRCLFRTISRDPFFSPIIHCCADASSFFSRVREHRGKTRFLLEGIRQDFPFCPQKLHCYETVGETLDSLLKQHILCPEKTICQISGASPSFWNSWSFETPSSLSRGQLLGLAAFSSGGVHFIVARCSLNRAVSQFAWFALPTSANCTWVPVRRKDSVKNMNDEFLHFPCYPAITSDFVKNLSRLGVCAYTVRRMEEYRFPTYSKWELCWEKTVSIAAPRDIVFSSLLHLTRNLRSLFVGTDLEANLPLFLVVDAPFWEFLFNYAWLCSGPYHIVPIRWYDVYCVQPTLASDFTITAYNSLLDHPLLQNALKDVLSLALVAPSPGCLLPFSSLSIESILQTLRCEIEVFMSKAPMISICLYSLYDYNVPAFFRKPIVATPLKLLWATCPGQHPRDTWFLFPLRCDNHYGLMLGHGNVVYTWYTCDRFLSVGAHKTVSTYSLHDLYAFALGQKRTDLQQSLLFWPTGHFLGSYRDKNDNCFCLGRLRLLLREILSVIPDTCALHTLCLR